MFAYVCVGVRKHGPTCLCADFLVSLKENWIFLKAKEKKKEQIFTLLLLFKYKLV